MTDVLTCKQKLSMFVILSLGMYRTAQVTHGLATHQQVKQEVLTCSFTLKLHRNISITKYKLRLSPLKFYTCEIFKDFITAGSPISLNPSRPNISMHILHTWRRICLTIKGFLSCWSFLLLSWLICVICYMCYMLYVLYVICVICVISVILSHSIGSKG